MYVKMIGSQNQHVAFEIPKPRTTAVRCVAAKVASLFEQMASCVEKSPLPRKFLGQMVRRLAILQICNGHVQTGCH